MRRPAVVDGLLLLSRLPRPQFPIPTSVARPTTPDPVVSVSLLASLLTLAAPMWQLRSPISIHQCATHGEETGLGLATWRCPAGDDCISGETGVLVAVEGRKSEVRPVSAAGDGIEEKLSRSIDYRFPYFEFLLLLRCLQNSADWLFN